MTQDYFLTRSYGKQEHSGYEEVTQKLRNRIATILLSRVSQRRPANDSYIWVGSLDYECTKYFGNTKGFEYFVMKGSFSELFSSIEIFFEVSNEVMEFLLRRKLGRDIREAFDNAGSVYQLNEQYKVELRIDEKTAKRLKEAALHTREQDIDTLDSAIHGLISREMSPDEVVNKTHIALEEFVNKKMGEERYKDSLKKIKKDPEIPPIFSTILGNLHGYRSQTKKVVHAGKESPPTTAEAVWFIDMVSSAINYLSSKISDGREQMN